MGRRKAAKTIDWHLIRSEYQANDISCRELAERYGIPVRAVAYRCERQRWQSGKKINREIVKDRKSTRLNFSHVSESRMPSSA